jgi:hypothetical protein
MGLRLRGLNLWVNTVHIVSAQHVVVPKFSAPFLIILPSISHRPLPASMTLDVSEASSSPLMRSCRQQSQAMLGRGSMPAVVDLERALTL